jgi:bacterioferritin
MTAESAGITKEQLIAELNNDLAKEYQALIQYVQHAAVITGPQYDAISAELVVHSNEEHQHAISLSEQIDFLGGVPAVDVAEVRVSDDSKVMLEQDLDGELDAIRRYKTRIAQAESLQEYGLRRALEDILIIEEEHARDLQNALDL